MSKSECPVENIAGAGITNFQLDVLARPTKLKEKVERHDQTFRHPTSLARGAAGSTGFSSHDETRMKNSRDFYSAEQFKKAKEEPPCGLSPRELAEPDNLVLEDAPGTFEAYSHMFGLTLDSGSQAANATANTTERKGRDSIESTSTAKPFTSSFSSICKEAENSVVQLNPASNIVRSTTSAAADESKTATSSPPIDTDESNKETYESADESFDTAPSSASTKQASQFCVHHHQQSEPETKFKLLYRTIISTAKFVVNGLAYEIDQFRNGYRMLEDAIQQTALEQSAQSIRSPGLVLEPVLSPQLTSAADAEPVSNDMAMELMADILTEKLDFLQRYCYIPMAGLVRQAKEKIDALPVPRAKGAFAEYCNWLLRWLDELGPGGIIGLYREWLQEILMVCCVGWHHDTADEAFHLFSTAVGFDRIEDHAQFKSVLIKAMSTNNAEGMWSLFGGADRVTDVDTWKSRIIW